MRPEYYNGWCWCLSWVQILETVVETTRKEIREQANTTYASLKSTNPTGAKTLLEDTIKLAEEERSAKKAETIRKKGKK